MAEKETISIVRLLTESERDRAKKRGLNRVYQLLKAHRDAGIAITKEDLTREIERNELSLNTANKHLMNNPKDRANALEVIACQIAIQRLNKCIKSQTNQDSNTATCLTEIKTVRKDVEGSISRRAINKLKERFLPKSSKTSVSKAKK